MELVVELGIGLLIAIGLTGIVLPVLPGTLLIAGAVLGWAIWQQSAPAWIATGVALAVLAVGTVLKYVVPGRRLQGVGVPFSTQLVGAVVGVIGFFLIPVVGLFLGFPLGVYLAELRRVGPSEAGPSTWHALRAIGLSIVIELLAGFVAAVAYVVGAFLA